MKKYFVLIALITVLCFALTGCFGSAYPQATNPPEQSYSSVEELSAAVAKANADTNSEDPENLRGLNRYYGLSEMPEGFTLNKFIVSSVAVIVEYTSGPVSEDSYNNKIQIGWIRETNVSTYLTDRAKAFTDSGMDYTTFTSGDTDYLLVTAGALKSITNSPGVSSAVTPEPTSIQICQVLYWVQDGNAFVGFFPLGYTQTDLSKYCHGLKVELK
jgi:hypothetical protein